MQFEDSYQGMPFRHATHRRKSRSRFPAAEAALVNMLEEVMQKTEKVLDGTNLRKEWMIACAACGLGSKIEVEGKLYDPRYEGRIMKDMVEMPSRSTHMSFTALSSRG